jgi:O-antigen ligase
VVCVVYVPCVNVCGMHVFVYGMWYAYVCAWCVCVVYVCGVHVFARGMWYAYVCVVYVSMHVHTERGVPVLSLSTLFSQHRVSH